ncbi:hypothetical protein [Alteromonas flava]|uniref:hypothetical protein n=1 Tax=Alteromonas flava TaxID=2048003 RepID=UPI000F6033A2|nr:hypothetical protein [Alteromonas flava]
MNIIAKITFLKIPRPPHGYRYFGKQVWMRMDTTDFKDLACYLSFLDDKEYYDGDTTEVFLGFYEGETKSSFTEGLEFSLRILDLQVAKGVIVNVS